MIVKLLPGAIDTFAIRRYSNELAAGLEQLGHDVEVVRTAGRTLPQYVIALLRARRLDADLFVICSEGLSYLLLALQSRKTLVVCHDIHPILETRMMPRSESMTARKRLFRVKYRMSLRVLRAKRHAGIVAISDHTACHLVEELRIPSHRIDVIHNGLSPAWLDPPASESDRIASIPSNRKILLHVGNDNWYKNLDGVIEAVALIGRSDLLLVKAGQVSSDSWNLIRLRGLNDRFLFLPDPTDEELRSLYRRAMVLVFPSRHEGFGWPPLEAMAAGCPVVVSDTGSLPEVCGDAAMYARPSDPRSIANGIATLLDDESERDLLVRRGKQRVEEFSWTKTAAAFLEVGRQRSACGS